VFTFLSICIHHDIEKKEKVMMVLRFTYLGWSFKKQHLLLYRDSCAC